jgi:AAHS family 4-hydroxybenzoate transporter-like MFS transporter
MATDAPIDVGALIDGQGIGRSQWRVIGLCALVALLDGLDLQSIGLAAPAMGAQLHIPPPSFGVVFSAALAGLAIGAFALGPVADRVGRKGVLLAATVCFGLFTLATAFATSLGELLAYRFLAGAGLGGVMPSFISLASEYVPGSRRAGIVSLLWAGFPLGGMVGGLVGSWIIPTYGWPSIFLLGGTAPILVAVLLLAALPESAAFLINRGKPPERVARNLRRVYPHVPIPDGAQFVLRQEATANAALRQLFTGGRAPGTILIWIAFFFAFMILVTNSAWSPILLRGDWSRGSGRCACCR